MTTPALSLRPARQQDYEFCRRLYFAENQRLLDQLQLDRAAHEMRFPDHWNLPEVRIIFLDRLAIGWMQSAVRHDSVYLGQLYLERAFQRRGIGAQVMQGLIDQAAGLHLPLELDVVRVNPAVHFYQRLGFHISGEEPYKYHMTLDPPSAHNP